MTDGSIRNVTIRQQVDSSDQAMPWQFLAGEVRILDYGDKRTVTSLVWLDVSRTHFSETYATIDFVGVYEIKKRPSLQPTRTEWVSLDRFTYVEIAPGR